MALTTAETTTEQAGDYPSIEEAFVPDFEALFQDLELIEKYYAGQEISQQTDSRDTFIRAFNLENGERLENFYSDVIYPAEKRIVKSYSNFLDFAIQYGQVEHPMFASDEEKRFAFHAYSFLVRSHPIVNRVQDDISQKFLDKYRLVHAFANLSLVWNYDENLMHEVGKGYLAIKMQIEMARSIITFYENLSDETEISTDVDLRYPSTVGMQLYKKYIILKDYRDAPFNPDQPTSPAQELRLEERPEFYKLLKGVSTEMDKFFSGFMTYLHAPSHSLTDAQRNEVFLDYILLNSRFNKNTTRRSIYYGNRREFQSLGISSYVEFLYFANNNPKRLPQSVLEDLDLEIESTTELSEVLRLAGELRIRERLDLFPKFEKEFSRLGIYSYKQFLQYIISNPSAFQNGFIYGAADELRYLTTEEA